jgi:hypothetical protein
VAAMDRPADSVGEMGWPVSVSRRPVIACIDAVACPRGPMARARGQAGAATCPRHVGASLALLQRAGSRYRKAVAMAGELEGWRALWRDWKSSREDAVTHWLNHARPSL